MNHSAYFVNDLWSGTTDVRSESQVPVELQHYFSYMDLKEVKNIFSSYYLTPSEGPLTFLRYLQTSAL